MNVNEKPCNCKIFTKFKFIFFLSVGLGKIKKKFAKNSKKIQSVELRLLELLLLKTEEQKENPCDGKL